MPTPRAKKVIAEYQAGKAQVAIAAEMGISRQRVDQVLKRYNVPRRPRHAPIKALAATVDRAIVETMWARRDVSSADLAARLGLASPKQVAGLLHHMGIRRPQGVRQPRKGLVHGTPVGYTYYKCRCDACRLRAQGFVEAGVPDPTHYR